MRSFNIVKAYIMIFVIVLTTGVITIAQQSNNNAFLFLLYAVSDIEAICREGNRYDITI